MMETEHKGYRITFAENEEVWRCWDLEIDAVKLSTLRSKIDKLDKQRRELAGVPAYVMSSQGKIEECVVTLIDSRAVEKLRTLEVKQAAVAAGQKGVWIGSGDQPEVWITYPNREPAKHSKMRDKVDIDKLIPMTPEAKAAVDELEKCGAALKAAGAALEAAKKAVPRMTLTELMNLKTPTAAAGTKEAPDEDAPTG